MREPALRSRRTELTRTLVLEALAGIIVEEGLADLSVQDVAERAGVSHRTVYRHFETREAMLDALVHADCATVRRSRSTVPRA